MRIKEKALYKTELGAMYCADSLTLMKGLPDDSIDLVVTSPPYALHFKKEYGNADQKTTCSGSTFAAEIKRVIKPTGSFVLNLGGAWQPGAPVRSLYHYRMQLLALVDELGFDLAQEFFWYNPAKITRPLNG